MSRIGLALSGGGFRATLYHLGVIRFLRDAGLLSRVMSITAVSGGSVLATHLVRNWDRYNGTNEEFDKAAGELIRFAQIDVRNRILRRIPLVAPVGTVRRFLPRRYGRQLTQTGMLERFYERELFGGACLSELPELPRLYLLSTNLSEGGLAAFSRDGLLLRRRRAAEPNHFERIDAGLATLAMAVTASSAFPGFFPPYQLTAADLGASRSVFDRAAFTDGGVIDNLGVRMFRYLERASLAREPVLEAGECADVRQLGRTLADPMTHAEGSPLRRLSQLVSVARKAGSGDVSDGYVRGLWEIVSNFDLSRLPEFQGVTLDSRDAESLLLESRSGAAKLEASERMWLNRHLIDAAFRGGTGQPCFRSLLSGFDGVLVSDAGKPFEVLPDASRGGLIRTAIRSSDILMNRVWELETESFADLPGFAFAPLTTRVDPEVDASALPMEIQRQLPMVRTDLDRFTSLEIRALTRHGYAVARSVTRAHPDLFGRVDADAIPWEPIPAVASESGEALSRLGALAGLPKAMESAMIADARALQRSSRRRVWGSLVDGRDWTTYFYIPLLVILFSLVPVWLFRTWRQAQIDRRLIETMARDNRDYEVLHSLIQEGTEEPFGGIPVESAEAMTPVDKAAFEIVSMSIVIDFRHWDPQAAEAGSKDQWIYGYRQIQVRRQKHEGETGPAHFIYHIPSVQPNMAVRPLTQRYPPKVRLIRDQAETMGFPYLYELEYDLSRAPAMEPIDLAIEITRRSGTSESSVFGFKIPFEDEVEIASVWAFLPANFESDNFDLIRYSTKSEEGAEIVEPTRRLEMGELKVFSFTLLSVKPGYTYECRWRDPG